MFPKLETPKSLHFEDVAVRLFFNTMLIKSKKIKSTKMFCCVRRSCCSALCAGLFQTETENQTKNIERNKSFNERLTLKISIVRRSQLLFWDLCFKQQPQEKIQFPAVVVYCRHRKVCYYTCQHPHPSAPSIPMKSHCEVSLMHRFHHTASGLTSVFTSQRWEESFLPFFKQEENMYVNVTLINYN